jgi:hypothetical protein
MAQSLRNRGRIANRFSRIVEPHWKDVDEWVKTFDVKDLPPEAAAFFWLLEAIEEMREV